MDTNVGRTGTNSSSAVTGLDPAERTRELADARRRASQAAIADAQAAEARRAESRADVRAILERAVGANTRLSIARNDAALTFVYRAIDRDTGEIVREWPPADFARFLEQNGVNLDLGDASGVVVDEEA
jgi:uncharacterized FlaG/YvyC family protein